MKLQGLSIIFTLIVVPIVLVISYFIQLQVDTINVQTEYDTKLLDATHGAMAAFELNTANEDLSSVADSLRTIIEASSNIFMNTLSTNLGLSNASKSRIQPFIPAILYTLYDGYYIDSPTKVREIAMKSTGVYVQIDGEGTNFSIPGLKYLGGNKYSYDPNDVDYHSIASVPEEDYGQLLYKTKEKTSENVFIYTTKEYDETVEYLYETTAVLKSYMPYSARYINNEDVSKKIDITINYTLDNFLNIIGNIGNVYYTKSGYLIKNDLVKEVSSEEGTDLLLLNENDAEEKIKEIINSGKNVKVKLKVNDFEEIEINSNKIDSNETSAIIYYVKAKIFSNWVYKNLGNLDGEGKGIKEKDIVENLNNKIIGKTTNGNEEIVYSFSESDNIIFDVNANPEDDVSVFEDHKYKVIRNSIQYNLNLAMSIYNGETASSYNFNMPVISNDEWRKIIDNVSIVTFLQGLKCGLKVYNNYAVVSSTNNELTVIPSEIYYTNKIKFKNINDSIDLSTYTGDVPVYHRIDCPRLQEELDSLSGSEKELTSFVSKEVKYDKVYKKELQKYEYNHRALACYTCIIDGNYKPLDLKDDRLKAYYTSLAKERNNIYKTNAIRLSEGYEMIYDHGDSISSSRNLSEIKQIEITFGNVNSDFTVNTVRFDVSVFGNVMNTEQFSLNTNQDKEQTIIIKNYFISNNIVEHGDFKISNVSAEGVNVFNAIKAIKIVYK